MNNDTHITKNGIKLNIDGLPILELSELIRNHMKIKPRPPMIFLEHLGREEENDEDPDYLEEKSQWEQELAGINTNMSFVFGTHVVSHPEDIPTYDSEDFDDLLEIMNYKGKISKTKKQLIWKRLYIKSTDDIKAITEKVMEKTKVSEVGVEAATETKFQTDETRDSDNGISGKESS